MRLAQIEQMLVFESAKGYVAGQAGPHYPAPVEAVKTIQKAASHGRDKALEIELLADNVIKATEAYEGFLKA